MFSKPKSYDSWNDEEYDNYNFFQHSNSMSYDDDLYMPFLSQPKPNENFDNLFNSFEQTQNQQSFSANFLSQYSLAVNENIECNLEPQQFDMLTNKYLSPLFESLVQSETKLGSIDCGEKADSTYHGTYSAVRSFNFWWANHHFDAKADPELYNIRFSYGDMIDGFQALCSCTHPNRNILLTNWIAKMVKRSLRKDEDSEAPVLGSAKLTYLNSIQRALKLYEKKNNLIEFYGANWTWRNSIYYSNLRGAYDRVTTKNETNMSPSKADRSVGEMNFEQFRAMHEYVWGKSEDLTISFANRLKFKVYYLVLATISFGCLRSRDEIAMCIVKEFERTSQQTILFQMKRPFKSHKLTAHKKVTRKPARLICGEKSLQCLEIILSHCTPEQMHEDFRMFLFPLPDVQETAATWWSCEPMGKNTIGEITKKMSLQMQKNKHPLFLENERFTNSSLRKYHSGKLMEANAPLIVQQASLAQNVRAYTDRRKQKKEEADAERLKVAQIVAGERKLWHSPEKENENPQQTVMKSLPLKKRPLVVSNTAFLNSTSNELHSQAQTSEGKQMRFTFSNATSKFSLTFDI